MIVKANGASRVVISGSGETLRLDLNGLIHFNGEAFSAQNVTIELNGPVYAFLNVSQSLNGEANGPVRITWKTKPQTISIQENGPVRMGPSDDEESNEW